MNIYKNVSYSLMPLEAWCHSFPYMFACQTCVCGMPSMVACQIYFLLEQSQIVLACHVIDDPVLLLTYFDLVV